jgi:predicted TIM-barrel fold metal-dependent hydrolase
MDRDHVEASLCFPNVVPRFCGQTFTEGKDRDLALVCVKAYNDWMLDEWCAGDGYGRLIPLTILPLWDVELAAAEVRRCAAKGTVAVSFSENPYALGLPSIHSGYWDPVFQECADSGVVLSMHIGSSSTIPITSPDAPNIVSSCLHFSLTAGSMMDFIFSGTLDRVPSLRLFFAESQAGWLPYVLEQADYLWKSREGNSTMGSTNPSPPSSYVAGRIFASVFNDVTALRDREAIGMNQLCFETDYPHSITSFPNSAEVALKQARSASLSDVETERFLRGNAIDAFGLSRIGITC